MAAHMFLFGSSGKSRLVLGCIDPAEINRSRYPPPPPCIQTLTRTSLEASHPVHVEYDKYSFPRPPVFNLFSRGGDPFNDFKLNSPNKKEGANSCSHGHWGCGFRIDSSQLGSPVAFLKIQQCSWGTSHQIFIGRFADGSRCSQKEPGTSSKEGAN